MSWSRAGEITCMLLFQPYNGISRVFHEFCWLIVSDFGSLKQDQGHEDAAAACILLRRAKTLWCWRCLGWESSRSTPGLGTSSEEPVVERSAVLRGTLFSFPVFRTEKHPQQPSASPLPPARAGVMAPGGSIWLIYPGLITYCRYFADAAELLDAPWCLKSILFLLPSLYTPVPPLCFWGQNLSSHNVLLAFVHLPHLRELGCWSFWRHQKIVF